MQVELLFPSAILRGSAPEFLNAAKVVSQEYIARVNPNCWNVCQSEAMFDVRLDGLLEIISRSSFEMLSEQGYDMTNAQTSVTQFWAQEFTKHGQHMEHVHSFGAQVTGFYFVEVPKDSAYPVVFDPRPGKKQISLPQTDQSQVTFASEQIVMAVQPGDLILMNAWLPHGFTRHESNSKMQFIHFTVNVEPRAPQVEII